MELFKAQKQWAERPDDERFSSLQEMHDACEGYRQQAREAKVNYSELRAVASEGDILLEGNNGTPAGLTHWAFGQVCQRANAPASYLRSLPAPLAATCLNHGMDARKSDERALLMFHNNGGLLMRAVTSTDYTRIWNSDITKRLLDILPDGWRVPPARPCRADQRGARQATEADVLADSDFGLSVRVGDMIAPAGLYASDHDCFAFLVNERAQIEDGTGGMLSRGFFAWNSEVGAASFGLCAFLYRHVCGNHIVWDAKGVTEIRLRHVGNADGKAFRSIRGQLTQYADQSVSDQEAMIKRAREFNLGGTKEEVLDRIFKLRVPVLSKAKIEQAYTSTERNYPIDGSPRTAWGMAQGLTRISQATPYADTRAEIDRAAGKVLSISF